MIELLILYELSRKVLTMYGVSKEIKSDFSVLTTPSYGTIKPALKRLEKGGCLKTQKAMSSGGRPSTYYSITNDGLNELKKLLLAPSLDNPIQFLPVARVKIACSELLNNEERKILFAELKEKSCNIILDTKNLLENRELAFYPKMVFENLTCEYENFITLIEGIEHACTRK